MVFLLYLCFIIFLIVGAFLILLVLIQKGRGGGLSGAFGGGGGNTAFGSKTGDVLTWATSIAFGVFLITAVALNLLADRYNASTAPVVAQQKTNGTGGTGGTGGDHTAPTTQPK
jgi:preprotein translocase subunit SecG